MRRHVPTLSLLGTMIFLPGCETPPRPGPTAAPATSTAAQRVTADDADVEIVTLQNADAVALEAIVTDLVDSTGSRDVHVVADARRNALLVHGPTDARSRLRKLVRQLDVPATR